jgi:hypothetical protein
LGRSPFDHSVRICEGTPFPSLTHLAHFRLFFHQFPSVILKANRRIVYGFFGFFTKYWGNMPINRSQEKMAPFPGMDSAFLTSIFVNPDNKFPGLEF